MAAPLPHTTVVAVAGDVLATHFGDEVVLLNLRDGVYYGLDGVGARVWTLVQEPRTVAALCEAVVRDYEVDRSRCERDLEGLIEDLAAHGLVELREAP